MTLNRLKPPSVLELWRLLRNYIIQQNATCNGRRQLAKPYDNIDFLSCVLFQFYSSKEIQQWLFSRVYDL
jgi:hypothetical protein